MSTVVDYRYGYDAAGQLVHESSRGQTSDFTYDRAGQVVSAVRTTQPDESYGYDAAGNSTESGRVVGTANRLLSDVTFDYQYDDEGNQTRKTDRASGEMTAFTYDYRNRLTGLERRSAGGVLRGESHFTYDVFDRLIVRSVNGVASATVYDGLHAWADFSGGSVTARYLFGERTDELLARWRPTDGLSWALADKVGSIREWVEASGAVVGNRASDAFGRIVASAGAVDRFAFQGREWEASVGWYQFRVVVNQALFLALRGYAIGPVAALLLYELTILAAALPIAMTWQRMGLVLLLTVAMCVTSALLAVRKVRTADPAELF